MLHAVFRIGIAGEPSVKTFRSPLLNLSKIGRFSNYIIMFSISDMYHPITILHTSFLVIRAVAYKQLLLIDTISLLEFTNNILKYTLPYAQSLVIF